MSSYLFFYTAEHCAANTFYISNIGIVGIAFNGYVSLVVSFLSKGSEYLLTTINEWLAQKPANLFAALKWTFATFGEICGKWAKCWNIYPAAEGDDYVGNIGQLQLQKHEEKEQLKPLLLI